uniref:F-box domain-containing protein n=1 Tax=Anopheles farauti TaxID=69004 RepID=A0A182QLE6_9DIPT
MKVDDSLIRFLTERCYNIRKLDISWCETISTTDVKRNVQEIAQHCRVLEQLDLMGCDQVEESDVDTILAQCPRLRLLNLTYCSRITLESIEAARIRYPKVSVISCYR